MYRPFNFEIPITRILEERAGGNEGCVIASLNGLCGSAVMRQIVVEDELKEWGRGILPGLSRFWSAMCFFVVRTSHKGSASAANVSPELPLSFARRFLAEDPSSFLAISVLICFSKAVEAFRIFYLLACSIFPNLSSTVPGQGPACKEIVTRMLLISPMMSAPYYKR